MHTCSVGETHPHKKKLWARPTDLESVTLPLSYTPIHFNAEVLMQSCHIRCGVCQRICPTLKFVCADTGVMQDA